MTMKTFARHSLALTALLSAFVARADIEGTVVRISDGDTLTVLDARHLQHKVRLAGIDAPEKRQAFGTRSKQSLSECAFGRKVTVAGQKLDRYGRLVGKLRAGGVDCNLVQLQRGLAWHYKQYGREQLPQDKIAYSRAEEEARGHRVGLWQEPRPVAPWEFRRQQR